MAFDKSLAERVRAMLPAAVHIEEKPMMGGLVFMVNDKMCVGIVRDDLMVRCGPALRATALASEWCHPMTMTGKSLRNFVVVDAAGLKADEELAYWLELARDYNKTAKAARKRVPKALS